MTTIALRKSRMTRAEFLDWAAAQEARYEFDGFQPVAMVGGTINHNRITLNLHRALYAGLNGSGCEPLGPDVGVATVGESVRFPDALVTCTKVSGTDRLVSGVVIVFEVLSPSSGRADRIEKLSEYHAVASIRRYVILEYGSIGLTVLSRADSAEAWRATSLVAGDNLPLPEIGIEIPVAELYEDVDLDGSADVLA